METDRKTALKDVLNILHRFPDELQIIQDEINEIQIEMTARVSECQEKVDYLLEQVFSAVKTVKSETDSLEEKNGSSLNENVKEKLEKGGASVTEPVSPGDIRIDDQAQPETKTLEPETNGNAEINFSVQDTEPVSPEDSSQLDNKKEIPQCKESKLNQLAGTNLSPLDKLIILETLSDVTDSEEDTNLKSPLKRNQTSDRNLKRKSDSSPPICITPLNLIEVEEETLSDVSDGNGDKGKEESESGPAAKRLRLEYKIARDEKIPKTVDFETDQVFHGVEKSEKLGTGGNCRIYRCYCGLEVKWSYRKFVRHFMERTIKNFKKFQCQLCTSSFTSSKVLLNHSKKKHKMETYSCGICFQQFDSEKLYDDHVKTEQSECGKMLAMKKANGEPYMYYLFV